MATTTKLAFISVLSDQELENAILTQKSELVNHYPFRIMDLADDALPSSNVLAGESAFQKPTTTGSIMPKLTWIAWMRSELAQLSHCARVGLSDGVQQCFFR